RRGGELQFQAGAEVQRRRAERATRGAAGGPGLQPPPGVRAGFERDDRWEIGFRRAVFQVLVEERAENLLAEVQRGVAVELQRAEAAAVPNLLTVMPRSQDEKHGVVGG